MVLTSMAPPRPSAAGVVSSIRLVRSREGIPSMKLEDGTGEQGFAHERGGENGRSTAETAEADPYKVDEPVGRSVFRIDSLTPMKSPRQLLVE